MTGNSITGKGVESNRVISYTESLISEISVLYVLGTQILTFDRRLP